MNYRTQFMQDYKGFPGLSLDPISSTVPDMSLTIRQLLENHSRGMSLDVAAREGEYFEDEPIPVFTDLTDMMEYRDDLDRRAKEVETRIEAEIKAKESETGPLPTQGTGKVEKSPQKGGKQLDLEQEIENLEDSAE